MTSIVAQRVAERVQDCMKAAGITQQQAADALFMSQSAFSRRALGRVEFRASELDALAKLLGTSTSYLLHGDSQTSPAAITGSIAQDRDAAGGSTSGDHSELDTQNLRVAGSNFTDSHRSSAAQERAAVGDPSSGAAKKVAIAHRTPAAPGTSCQPMKARNPLNPR